jgi:ankyrin repeat protein
MSVSQDDLTREFILAAHADLERVRALLAEHPDLLQAAYDWGPSGLEDGLSAAAHVGHRIIAEFLLAQGVPSTMCAAAMLGRTEEVRAFLAADPSQANARGAHGIPVLFHAAMSGRIEIVELLWAAGCREGFNQALHGAVNFGHQDMAAWLLTHGVTDAHTPDFQGKTPLQKAEERGDAALIALISP